MEKLFIGFGSNIEPKRQYIERAIDELKRHPAFVFVKESSLYETEPVGVVHQPFFLNMVAEFETSLVPEDVFPILKEIEKKLGRIERERWGPREIDLDILFYGNHVVETDTLMIPHRALETRRFVLVPLAEIAPEFVDPVSGKTISQLLAMCPDSSFVHRIR